MQNSFALLSDAPEEPCILKNFSTTLRGAVCGRGSQSSKQPAEAPSFFGRKVAGMAPRVASSRHNEPGPAKVFKDNINLNYNKKYSVEGRSREAGLWAQLPRIPSKTLAGQHFSQHLHVVHNEQPSNDDAALASSPRMPVSHVEWGNPNQPVSHIDNTVGHQWRANQLPASLKLQPPLQRKKPSSSNLTPASKKHTETEIYDIINILKEINEINKEEDLLEIAVSSSTSTSVSSSSSSSSSCKDKSDSCNADLPFSPQPAAKPKEEDAKPMAMRLEANKEIQFNQLDKIRSYNNNKEKCIILTSRKIYGI